MASVIHKNISNKYEKVPFQSAYRNIAKLFIASSFRFSTDIVCISFSISRF